MNGRPFTPLPFLPVVGHVGQCRRSYSCPNCLTLWHRTHFSDLCFWVVEVLEGMVGGMVEGTLEGPGNTHVVVARGPVAMGVAEELSLGAEDGVTTGVELVVWKGVGVETFWPTAGFPGPEPKLDCLGNAPPMSLSYTKLNVLGKHGASPDAILWMWSISGLGSSLVKYL